MVENLSVPFRFVFSRMMQMELKIVLKFMVAFSSNTRRLARRGWRKLTVLGETDAQLKGRCLFLDLDVVIVGDLDQFYEVDSFCRV